MSPDDICRKCSAPLLAGNRYAQSAFCRPCIGGRVAADYAAELARASEPTTAAPHANPPATADDATEAEMQEYLARMAAYSVVAP